MVIVRCPSCGHAFQVDLRKGKGAHYTRGGFTPTRLHEEIMRAIRTIVSQKMEGATKKEIEAYLRSKGISISGNSLSGRLSELLGAGLVEVLYTQVRVYDEKTRQYRFRKTPVWYLSAKGVEYLRSRPA
jgi:DNA-binding transcriptional ArsR family regulator